MANSRKRISELPPLNVASLDTTFVLGISGSTTYKISINNLTSSLDGAFATDLVTNALSSSLNSKLSTSSFNSYTASAINGTISGSSQLTSSFDTRYIVSGSVTQTTWDNISGKPAGIVSQSTDLSSLNTFTASISTASLVDRLNTIESVSGSWITESETGSFLTSLSGAISSSAQITTFGFVSGSYETTGRGIISSSANLVTTSSFNSYTASISTASLVTSISNLNSATSSYLTSLSGAISSSSQLTSSYDARYVISGSVGATPSGTISGSAQITTFGFISSSQTINTSSLATTGSNTFTGTETISGSLLLSGSFSYNGTPLQNGFAFAQPIVSKIVSNAAFTGAASWTGTYVSTGGAIIVRADVTGYKASVSAGTAVLYRDGVAVASQSFFFNQINVHTTIPTITYVRNSETGSHTYSIGFTDIVADVNDYLNITVLEYGNSAILPATLISGSSQLTSSLDTRYVASGSISATPAGTISGSAQITTLGFVSGSYLTSLSGAISSSSQLTSSYDSRYSLSGSVLTSFSSSVDNRLDTLEASIITGSVNYVQKLGSRVTGVQTVGVNIISENITTTGNPVQIMVTGDANPVNVSSWTRLQIYRNETAIGNIVQVENSSNLNVPYCVNVIDTPSAGTYAYSMRTVSGISGLFDFGESTGPTLTAVELKTNTNLPSTNNTFTGTNRFNGQVTLGGAGGDEGGEIQLATAQTNTTLAAGVVSVDVYRDRLRIFEGGGNSRGVHIDLSKAPAGNAGELMWKVSGFVNAGTFLTLDNLKVTVTTGTPRGLSIGAVSTNFSANVSGWFAMSTFPTNGSSSVNNSITTTATTSVFGWDFGFESNTAQYNILDTTNSRMYRVMLMIGFGFNNNFISIERLF
jgi:hypothetical protein